MNKNKNRPRSLKDKVVMNFNSMALEVREGKDPIFSHKFCSILNRRIFCDYCLFNRGVAGESLRKILKVPNHTLPCIKIEDLIKRYGNNFLADLIRAIRETPREHVTHYYFNYIGLPRRISSCLKRWA